jgi:hypothetical protein
MVTVSDFDGADLFKIIQYVQRCAEEEVKKYLAGRKRGDRKAGANSTNLNAGG